MTAAEIRAGSGRENRNPAERQHGGRRRWQAVVAAAAVATLVVGGLVVLHRDRTPSHIRTTSSTTPSASTPEVAPASDGSRVTTTTGDEEISLDPDTPVAVEAVTVDGDPSPIAGSSLRDPDVEPQLRFEGGRTALGAWGDGFLFAVLTGGVQLLPEWTDDMLSRFPPEVNEAYPGGLQGPVGEAITQLQQDGLLDEVQATLEGDAELEAFVYSGPTTPIELRAESSIDGETWSAIEITPPAGIDVDEIAIVGDRIVAVGRPQPEPDRNLVDDLAHIIVASTTDLDRWSTQAVPAPQDPFEDYWIVANPDGWVAMTDSGWAARWDGEPAPTEIPILSDITASALPGGFLAQGPAGISYSGDGTTWQIVDSPSDEWLAGALPLDDGRSIIVTWTNTCQTRFHLVDRTASNWQQIDLDLADAPRGLLPHDPSRFSRFAIPSATRTTSAALFDTSGPPIETYVWEQGGLQLTMRWCGGFQLPAAFFVEYELVDLATGDVVLTEATGAWPGDDPDAFEHLTLDTLDEAETITVRDPTSGNILLTADFDDATFSVTGVAGVENVHLLATRDAIDWIVDDSPTLTEGLVARNGDTVLLAAANGWLRYTLPNP